MVSSCPSFYPSSSGTGWAGWTWPVSCSMGKCLKLAYTHTGIMLAFCCPPSPRLPSFSPASGHPSSNIYHTYVTHNHHHHHSCGESWDNCNINDPLILLSLCHHRQNIFTVTTSRHADLGNGIKTNGENYETHPYIC